MVEAGFCHPRYEPGALLGSGSQGFVLRVLDREAPTRQLVAKVWHAGHFDESALAAEFALLRRLDLPGLVRAHDWGRDTRSGAPFFVEDFVPGEASTVFVAGDLERRAERLFAILSEVAVTLAGLHEAAFLHGDLKPEHVRVTPAGRVTVLDLGAALRLGQSGPFAFTRAFAAPEVLAGARPNRVSDLFSLGASCWAMAAGDGATRGSGLRRIAPWVPPSLSEVIDALVEPHPRDRPQSAEEVLRRLGMSEPAASRRLAPAPLGRAAELKRLQTPQRGVRYVTGPSGSGKSHLVRELVTRALLSGRPARRVAFPNDDALLVAKLLAFFRGDERAWPFEESGTDEAPLLLALDEFHAAPDELAAALDAYRCRAKNALPIDVLAAARQAPGGAVRIELGALGEAALAELCRGLGVETADAVRNLTLLSGGNPGFLVGAHGRVPLTRDTVLERAKSVSAEAAQMLAALALLGGVAPERTLSAFDPESSSTIALNELILHGLVMRRDIGGELGFSLVAHDVADEIASALGSFELGERLALKLMSEERPGARLLASLAGSAFPPTARERLLEYAAKIARSSGLAGAESDALFALCATPSCRTPENLLRIECLTRQAGAHHPQVLSWIAEAAEAEPRLRPLLFRREAERAARASDFNLAEQRTQQAENAAMDLGDPVVQALVLATRGAVALFKADVPAADRALQEAAARLARLRLDDAEELARLEHNRGVVALYGNRVEEAAREFERSLEIKRALGDRAGVRSCLLNLGLSLARLGRYAEAAQSLDEAIELARSLGQQAGRAWCLAARADLELRRGDGVAAERYRAEAAAIAEAPPLVRADLAILAGQIALLAGDARAALAALVELDPAARAGDVSLAAKATVVEGFARLASLPAEPRRAARLAVSVIRSTRAARLLELEQQGVSLLRAARLARTSSPASRYVVDMADFEAAAWPWLQQVSAGAAAEPALLELLRLIRSQCGAERTLLAVDDATGQIRCAWGVDLDGYALADAAKRCDPVLVRRTLEANSILHQRDTELLGERGARVAIPVPSTSAASRAVLVLEQRFRPGAFDQLADSLASRFAVLSGLALRLLNGASVAQAPAASEVSRPSERSSFSEVDLQSTALPLRAPRRTIVGIVGSSRSMNRALARLEAAIDSDLPVLVRGETGTGKELFARALHELGGRARGPFVAVNCAAIADSLFEAELFGHARGAFTGADRPRSGLLARAEGGTLFLDEIGDLPLARQAALLRVLETRRYRPLGTDDERAFDVRIASATNRDLEALVASGAFRQDLLFRINVVEIEVPPLREREEDIPLLTRAFVARKSANLTFSSAAMTTLERYPWPGNVRELEHQIERLLAAGIKHVEVAHLPRAIRLSAEAKPRSSRESAAPGDERAAVELALSAANGNISHAARALGLTRHGFKKRMLRLGLRAKAAGRKLS